MGIGQDVGHGALEPDPIVADAEAIVELDTNIRKRYPGPLREGSRLRHAAAS